MEVFAEVTTDITIEVLAEVAADITAEVLIKLTTSRLGCRL
jgi:hypothetical protein